MKKDVLIYYDLITTLKTTQEVESFVSEIDTLMFEFYKTKGLLIHRTLDSISFGTVGKIMQVFLKNNLDINNKNTFVSFFQTLKILIKKLKVIKLVLAFDPTRKTIERIHNFVKENIGIGYILDIEVYKEVLGGAIIIFNGKYKDSTLKKSLEEVCRSRRSEILPNRMV
jgi:F0F1-type ATP synthase delta subunit